MVGGSRVPYGSAPRRGERTMMQQPAVTLASAQPRWGSRVPVLFLLLLGLTYLLIVLGALVRAKDAGLACPDWPLCFGELVPVMNVQVAFEWTHRAVAGTVALAFAALAVHVLRRPPVAPSVKRLLALGAGLLAVQIVLGGLTVLLKLAAWTVTAHLLTGNAFAATMLCTALALRDQARGRADRPAASPAARIAVCAAAALLCFQMFLGGLVASTYSGLACPEWPTCNGGQWFPTWRGSVGVHVLHRLNGYALFLALATAALVCRHEGPLARIARVAVGLALCEVGVGIANVLLGIPFEITGLHSAFAAALVLTLTLAVRDLVTRDAVVR